MILLDTNVISEPLRLSPEIRVINWIDAQSLETLYLSAITVAELRFGVASLPDGKSVHVYSGRPGPCPGKPRKHSPGTGRGSVRIISGGG
jgi:hypothetical protein